MNTPFPQPAFTLSESELRSFLQEPPAPFWRSWSLVAIPAMVLLIATSFYIVNQEAIKRVRSSRGEVAAAAIPAIPTPTTTAAPTAPTPEPTPRIPLNTVSYESLAISAPIAWNIPLSEEKNLYKELEKGVVHLAGTALPNQKGTTVLFGHSSQLPWQAGAYKTIFASLHNAQVGESIEINYNNHSYRYVVTKRFEVKPTQVEVLQAAEKPGLRLITCTPLGTNLRRLVIEAELVSPDPASNEPFTQNPLSDSLPSDR